MKRKLWITVAIITSIAVLFSLNWIMLMLQPKEYRIREVIFSDYSMVGPGYALLNNLDYDEADITELICANGWAFAETEDEDSVTTGFLLLNGTKKTFITDECAFRYSDMQTRLSSWKKIRGKNHNFAVFFSTVTLPNDIYEIYIYVIENGKDKGIVDTGKGFIKKGVNIIPFTRTQVQNSIAVEQIPSTFDEGWHTLDNNEGFVDVYGWDVVFGKDSEESTYYVVFVGNNGKNLTRKMPSLISEGVRDKIGNDCYLYSFFRGSVMNTDLPDQSGLYYIAAENQGQWYVSGAKPYQVE